MTIPKHVIRQRDFTAGQVSPEAKRRDDVDVLAGSGRTVRNWRVEGGGNLRERPGTTALFVQGGRTEKVRLSATESVLICFDYDADDESGRITVRETDGTSIDTDNGYAWDNSTVGLISFTVINRDVIIAFPGQGLKVVRVSSGLGSATFSDFAFATGVGSQKREPFYRFADSVGITIVPSARTGSITLTASAAWFNAGHVGSVIRWVRRQVLITAFTSSTSVTGTVLQTLPDTISLEVDGSIVGFEPGQIIEGADSGARGEIVAVTPGSPKQTLTLVVERTSIHATYFLAGEVVVGPLASAAISGAITIGLSPVATTQWDESLISDYRGWPRSVTNDRSRLIFSDFPQLPEAVAWSAISVFDDFFVDADSTSAILEFVPGKARALYVTGGADQFIFTDRGVYYIPISAANPLRAGSIEMRQITSEGAAQVRPVDTTEGLLFVVAGSKRLSAIVGTGQTTRPYISRDVSKYHQSIFSDITCVAVSQGEGAFPERYIYALNSDGTICIGRFESSREWIGWHPWDGAGVFKWVSADGEDVYLSSSYTQGAVTTQLVELLDGDALMDAEIPLDDIPTALAPGVGEGPLWWLPEATISVTRNGRDYGTRTTDSDGNINWLDNDDSGASGWMIGFAFTCEFEPFVPHTSAGQSFRQAMRLRRVSGSEVTVWHNSPFVWGDRQVPAYVWGEVLTDAPAVREASYSFRHLGRAADPRITLLRERPGRLSLVEIALEVSI